MNNKTHLTPEGLNYIVSLRAIMNNGLNETLQIAFPNLIPLERPSVPSISLLDPHWVVGFVDGEGNFYIRILSSSSYRSGYQTQLIFRFHQSQRDQALINYFITYFKCGFIETNKTTKVIGFNVVNFNHLQLCCLYLFFLHIPYKVKKLKTLKILRLLLKLFLKRSI